MDTTTTSGLHARFLRGLARSESRPHGQRRRADADLRRAARAGVAVGRRAGGVRRPHGRGAGRQGRHRLRRDSGRVVRGGDGCPAAAGFPGGPDRADGRGGGGGRDHRRRTRSDRGSAGADPAGSGSQPESTESGTRAQRAQARAPGGLRVRAVHLGLHGTAEGSPDRPRLHRALLRPARRAVRLHPGRRLLPDVRPELRLRDVRPLLRVGRGCGSGGPAGSGVPERAGCSWRNADSPCGSPRRARSTWCVAPDGSPRVRCPVSGGASSPGKR